MGCGRSTPNEAADVIVCGLTGSGRTLICAQINSWCTKPCSPTSYKYAQTSTGGFDTVSGYEIFVEGLNLRIYDTPVEPLKSAAKVNELLTHLSTHNLNFQLRGIVIVLQSASAEEEWASVEVNIQNLLGNDRIKGCPVLFLINKFEAVNNTSAAMKCAEDAAQRINKRLGKYLSACHVEAVNADKKWHVEQALQWLWTVIKVM